MSIISWSKEEVKNIAKNVLRGKKFSTEFCRTMMMTKVAGWKGGVKSFLTV